MNVLLLDEAFMSGAQTALGLRRAGCRVRVVAAAGGVGDYGDTGWRWTLAPRLEGAAFSATLDRVLGEEPFDVVYPVTEPLQRYLAQHARPFFPAFEPWQQCLMADKRCMSAAAGRAGVLVPEERDATDDEQVRRGARDLGFPLVVKGSVGRGGSTTAIVSSLADALTAARRLRSRHVTPFLQQYIHGRTYLAGGLFDAGKALRFYAGVKTVQVPARIGPAAELLSTAEPALVAEAMRAFRAAGVSGIASVDFVRDALGRFFFLELNPRPWGSITAARDAGVDLFGPLVALWTGERIETRLDYAPGVRSPVFPLCLLSPRGWRSRNTLGALHATAARAVRTDPALALHIAHRLVRVGVNWR